MLPNTRRPMPHLPVCDRRTSANRSAGVVRDLWTGRASFAGAPQTSPRGCTTGARCPQIAVVRLQRVVVRRMVETVVRGYRVYDERTTAYLASSRTAASRGQLPT